MKTVDTNEYISVLKELTDSGKEVGVLIAGNSMSPFLRHQRDYICFKRLDRMPVKGDMVFYQRKNGQYIMHRIYKVKDEGFYIVGDAQMEIEGPVHREQIFAVVTRVKRKGKWIEPGDFWWEFFEHVWIRIVPMRRLIRRTYREIYKCIKNIL